MAKVTAVRGTLKASMLQALIDKQFALFENVGNRHLFEAIAKELYPNVKGFGTFLDGNLIRLLIDTPLSEDDVDFIVPERNTYEYDDNHTHNYG